MTVGMTSIPDDGAKEGIASALGHAEYQQLARLRAKILHGWLADRSAKGGPCPRPSGTCASTRLEKHYVIRTSIVARATSCRTGASIPRDCRVLSANNA